MESSLNNQTVQNGSNNNGNFLCGVVEGFYGRPWTTDQRKDLFKRMNKLGMNTYLYAPKDDYKHRAYWREMYSVEEAEHLTNLITAAEAENVTFLYALSPGLDITFSSSKDVTFLKRKLEQVQQFGCKAFALLFDDIDAEMSSADKEAFQSFAQAQVSITNEVYQHLDQPIFLFCPTEYCASRAIPTVTNSEYLTTLGAKLLPGVEILWTGSKVITKKITVQSLEEISKVLQRPPIIWDNIHANDYDQKRLFLGPYDGRSTQIIPYLRGVLTNPNCEYEANFIAFHTLSQWSKCNEGELKKDVILSASPVTSDIKLETDGQYSSEDDLNSSYKPRQALFCAIHDWMTEIYTPRCANGRTAPTFMPTAAPTPINTCATVTNTTITTSTSMQPPILTVPSENENESYMQPTMNPINSLVNATSPVSIPPHSSNNTAEIEPMDCVSTPGSSPAVSNLPIKEIEIKPAPDAIPTSIDNASMENMQVDNETTETNNDVRNLLTEEDSLTTNDVLLLVDMFYLPFEHGSQAVDLLNRFHWLKANAHYLSDGIMLKEDTDKSAEVLGNVEKWKLRAQEFEDTVKRVNDVANKFTKIPNRSLFYDVFPYIWDMRGTLSLLASFVRWLGLGQVVLPSTDQMPGSQFTWTNKNYREAFMSGDQEPWVFRGGLQAEFQRMLPIEGANDLFAPLLPENTTSMTKCAIIRPYLPSDKAAVYDLCRKVYDKKMDVADSPPEYPDLVAHELVGGFLHVSPEYCFVVEDDAGIFGYVLAAHNAKAFYAQLEQSYLPMLRDVYPKAQKHQLSPVEETIAKLHEPIQLLPEPVYTTYPSLLRIDLLPERNLDPSVPRRMVACVLSALKANGSHGVHGALDATDNAYLEFYTKLGFFAVPMDDATERDFAVVGRII